MKIGDPIYRGDEVPLPVEVLTFIASYAGMHGFTSQSTLWSCCLVSKSWYAASISHLYLRPILHNRNFDKFARTICPPVGSYKPQIGLEDLIKHLDMGGLAYESSKSLTARLLRRTRKSLESFSSPAVTFSIASLAPLSKCANLQLLDLSSDSYDMHLSQILDAIARLDLLTTLRLPRDSVRTQVNLQPNCVWPKNLQCLQIGDSSFETPSLWASLFASFPKTLNTLRITDFVGEESMHTFKICDATSTFIESLDVGIAWRENPSDFPLPHFFRMFPHLRVFKLPAYVAVERALWERQLDFVMNDDRGEIESDSLLEVLVLTERQPPATKSPNLTTEVVKKYINKFPRLRRLELPEKYVNLGNTSDQKMFEDLASSLEERADQDKRESSGIYLC